MTTKAYGRWARLVALVAVAACASTDDMSAPLPPPGPSMSVTMREFEFEHLPVGIGGRTLFRVDNAGQVEHEFVLGRLSDQPTSSAGSAGGESPKVVIDTVALVRRPPGGSGIFAADLQPGRYLLICQLRAPDGKLHSEKGMRSELMVETAGPVPFEVE